MRTIHLFHDNTLILQLIKIFSQYTSLPSLAWYAMPGEEQKLAKNRTDLWQNSKQCNIGYLDQHRAKLAGNAELKWEEGFSFEKSLSQNSRSAFLSWHF